MSRLRSLGSLAGDRKVLVVSILMVTAAAWLALWRLEDLGHGSLHHHGQVMTHTMDHAMDHAMDPAMDPAMEHAMAAPEASAANLMLLFVVGWTMMTVAMMLPTSLPVVATFHTIAGRRRDRPLLVALVILGYLGAWSLFGVLVYLAILLIEWLVGASPWLAEHAWIGSPLILILAGLFQFSKLKYRCLEKCRSPLTFVMEHWQGRRYRWQALRLGVDNGVFCVGCCWALMLLMFVAGVGSLLWMLILAIAMAVEKNMPWGRRLSMPLGVALIGWGGVMFALELARAS